MASCVCGPAAQGLTRPCRFPLQVAKAAAALLKWAAQQDGDAQAKKLFDDDEQTFSIQINLRRIPENKRHKPIMMCVRELSQFPHAHTCAAPQPGHSAAPALPLAAPSPTHCTTLKRALGCVCL